MVLLKLEINKDIIEYFYAIVIGNVTTPLLLRFGFYVANFCTSWCSLIVQHIALSKIVFQ
jgi:hypothetical protein